MNLSVKNKIFSIFVITTIISISAIGWFGFSSAKDAYIDSALSINQGETKALANEIKGVLGTIPEDVLYNANFYALEKLLVWEDLEDKKKIQKWKNIYISSLKDYVLNKQLYYQIRVLDNKGNEKILLKYNEKSGTIIDTPKNRLQNKSHINYFLEAKKLKKGKFYISPMTLNIENGVIEKPYVPVIRYSTPIIDQNGEFKGVIVLNFNATYILNEIATAKAIDDTREVQKYYLVNEQGYYLFIGDKSKRWGLQLGHDYSFTRDYPGILEKFKDKDQTTFIKNGRIFSMDKIYPNKADNQYRFWYLVTEIDEQVAFSSLETFINIFFIILIFVLFFSLLTTNWYISKIITPLEKVTSQLKALSRGEIKKEEITYSANDEVGEIVSYTTILVDAIETTIQQARLVANGDFSKEINLLSKNDQLGLSIQDMTKRLKEITELSSSLSNGNYDVNVIVKGSSDHLGIALKDMVTYLKTITELTESIALGDLNVMYKAKGEQDRLGLAILQMTSYLRSILKQANSISKNDFSGSIEARSKDDELGIALITMTDILRDSAIKNKNEIYFSEGIATFSDSLSGISETSKLAKEAITMACRYIDASSGAIYIYNKDNAELNLIASYAYTSRDALSNIFKLGEGVVGQVALEKEPILLKNIKDDEYKIQSATTVASAKEVYTFPLIIEGELFGVAEVMSFESFSDIQKDYLAKAASIFSTALHTTSQNAQIKVLLEKSQQAFEELQVQSEELQESNVQMEEQQQQLTIQSKELTDKNNTLANAKKEIDKRAEDFERASTYKSEFLANMSHELRTPLNSIILLSKLLTQNQNNTLNEKDVEKSSVIHKAGNDLLLLINDILDLTKIESGNMELLSEEINTKELCEDMKGLFNALADEKKIEFIINDSFKSAFVTDKTKIAQVLKNLLSNSFKFTKKGSITLSIIKEKSNLLISVKDTGIGIPNDKLEYIFDAFKQVDGSISREFGGTGLGLSITKTIVDLMGGRIDLSSTFGEGTIFKITLPLENNSVIEKAIKEEIQEFNLQANSPEVAIILDEDDTIFNNKVLSEKNILIVDDDSRNIFTLTSILESMDADVYSAFNGQEAIDTLEEGTHIDLILMDIMMPVMDGLKAIESIKANKKFKDIPIIAITAKTMPEDKQACLDAGADEYLSKPLEHQALISTIKAWVK
ncbi:MAG: response regulator [Helicobacteraceae bacterium]|nr:response regulator [Helicobacteraceae bacterium]